MAILLTQPRSLTKIQIGHCICLLFQACRKQPRDSNDAVCGPISKCSCASPYHNYQLMLDSRGSVCMSRKSKKCDRELDVAS